MYFIMDCMYFIMEIITYKEKFLIRNSKNYEILIENVMLM